MCAVFFYAIMLLFCLNHWIFDLMDCFFLQLSFYIYSYICKARIYCCKIQSEPVDQSNGSVCDLSLGAYFFMFFYLIFIYTTFFCHLCFFILFKLYFLFFLPLKNHKNIFLLLVTCFFYFIIIIYLVVIFTILFIYHSHLMHYFISCHFIFFIIF